MKQKAKFDIFISYRRDGGMETARIFYERLLFCGYRVSFDIETLRSGKFNEQLYERIEQCKDFIVIMSKDSLLLRNDREDDWFRLEISKALACKKNIIPVYLRDFQVPQKDSLPEDIRELPFYQAVKSSADYFDSAFENLCSKLKSCPYHALVRRIIKSIFLIFLMLLAAGGYAVYHFRENIFPYPFTQTSKQHFRTVLANIQTQAGYMDIILRSEKIMLDSAVDSVNSDTPSTFLTAYNVFRNSMADIDIKQCKPTSPLMDEVLNMPIDRADFSAMYDFLKTQYDETLDTASFLREILKPETLFSKSERLKIIKLYQENNHYYNEIYAYCIISLFHKITPDALAEFKTMVATRWQFPYLAGKWTFDVKDMDNEVNQRFNMIESNLNELGIMIGNQRQLYRQELKEYKEQLQNIGAAPEKAIQMAEDVQQVMAGKALAGDLRTSVDEKKAKMSEKFKPEISDKPGILWGKFQRFLNVNMPEDALKAIDVLRNKKTAEFPEEVCNTATAVIRQRGNLPFNSGVVVCMFEQPATSHAIFQLGDIITQIDGTPCRKFEDYRAKAGRKYLIWRLNQAGKFESHEAVMPENQPRTAIVNLRENAE